MSLPGRRIVFRLHGSAITPRCRITTTTCSSWQQASGPTWQEFTSGTNTSKATRKTAWRRRSTSQSRRSELTRPNKKAVACSGGFFIGSDDWAGIAQRVLLGECRDCGCLVVLDVKDGVELRDLQQVMDLFGQVQQLQFAA